MEYRFKYQVVDENDEVVAQGSTYMTEIDEYGSCESVELEIAATFRAIRRKTGKEELVDDEEAE